MFYRMTSKTSICNDKIIYLDVPASLKRFGGEVRFQLGVGVRSVPSLVKALVGVCNGGGQRRFRTSTSQEQAPAALRAGQNGKAHSCGLFYHSSIEMKIDKTA